jgi:hypothetical protein
MNKMVACRRHFSSLESFLLWDADDTGLSVFIARPSSALCFFTAPFSYIFLQEKAVEATKQKEEKWKEPKPEEQEGMPPRQHSGRQRQHNLEGIRGAPATLEPSHCPHEKRRGDKNPKCHEEQQKDVA